MSVSIYFLLISLFARSTAYAEPKRVITEKIVDNQTSNQPFYRIYLWEERLRDEHYHIVNQMSISEEYVRQKNSLHSKFQKRYSSTVPKRLQSSYESK